MCAICSAQHLLPNQRFRLWEDLGRPTQLAIQLEALVGRDISQRLRAGSRLCCRSCRADVQSLKKLKESFDKRQKELLTKIHSKLPGPAHRLPSLPEKRPLTSPVSHTGVSPLAKRHIPELPLTTPLRNSLTQTQEKGCGPANYSGRRQDTRRGVTLASSPSGRRQDTRQRVTLASSPSGRQQDTRQRVALASSPSGRRQDTRQGVTLASSPSGRQQDTRRGVTLASSPSGRWQDTRLRVTLASSPSGRRQDTRQRVTLASSPSGRRQDTRQRVTLASSPSGRQQDTRQRVALASSPSGRRQDTRQGVTLASSPSGRQQDTRRGVTLASSPSGRRQDTRQGVTLASSPSGRRQDTRQGVTLASSPSGRWQDTRQGGSPSGRLQKISQPQVGKRVTLPHIQEVARRELFPASKSKRNPRVVATHQRPPMLLSSKQNSQVY